MKTTKLILSAILILSLGLGIGQKGKNGTLTLSGTPDIVNVFTTLTADASTSNNTITVANSALNSTSYGFVGNLEPGDLILIIQMQGIHGDDMIGVPNWNGTAGIPSDPSWGQITDYRNCGNNEYAEVKSVPTGTSIELRCGLSNDYTASGNVQVIRVPRFEDLTIIGTLTTTAWDGSTGGVLAIEVNNDLILTGSITASDLGFRGGIANNATSNLGVANWSRPLSDAGGMKGESIRGWFTEYADDGGAYCKGAPANGGGGGNGHNGGGGGGGNAGDINNWIDGVGVPLGNYNSWDIETEKNEITPAPINGVVRSGGGRGGFTFSGAYQNANTVPAGDPSWGGDFHKNRGGLGGRPLDYSTGKIFLGGAGGAGDLNEASSTGGSGGNGGGIIYILNYGSVSGTGTIVSLGQIAEDVSAPNASWGNIAGNDGAGGGGAGGTVIINSNSTVTGISIDVNGGNGGNQVIIDGTLGNMDEAEGPGGGGGGGYIAISNGVISTTANGGANGVTNSETFDTEFPSNGATGGGVGLPNETISNFFLTTTNDTICSGSTSTLTASVTGTLVGTITWYDAEVGGNIIGTNTLTTGPLTSNTTYWVGTCPGNYLIPVSVIISPPITFNDASVVIGNENCGLSDGTISGINIAGGTAPLSYEWNGTSTTLDLASASASSYTLVVSDAKGCVTTVGTYVIGSATSIALDANSIVILDENCGNINGGITGITTTGGSGTVTYTWNGSASTNEDLANVAAGSYTLVATDGLGCSTSTGPHVITNIAGLSIDISGLDIMDESCTLSNGDISGITASGGTAPLTYSWNGNTTLTADTADLAAGSYTLIVSDAFGCTDQSGPYAVIDNAAPLLDTSSLVITNETCGSINGSIAGIMTIGGNAPLSYSWNTNTTLTADTALLGGGSYVLTVTDALGCFVISNPVT